MLSCVAETFKKHGSTTWTKQELVEHMCPEPEPDDGMICLLTREDAVTWVDYFLEIKALALVEGDVPLVRMNCTVDFRDDEEVDED